MVVFTGERTIGTMTCTIDGGTLRFEVADKVFEYPVKDVMIVRSSPQVRRQDARYTHAVDGKLPLKEIEADAVKAALAAAKGPDLAALRVAAALPGLEIVRAKFDAIEAHDDRAAAGMRRGVGIAPLGYTADDVRAEYPRECAYLRYLAIERSASHHRKGDAARKAAGMILDGADLADAEKVATDWLPESAMWS